MGFELTAESKEPNRFKDMFRRFMINCSQNHYAGCLPSAFADDECVFSSPLWHWEQPHVYWITACDYRNGWEVWILRKWYHGVFCTSGYWSRWSGYWKELEGSWSCSCTGNEYWYLARGNGWIIEPELSKWNCMILMYYRCERKMDEFT